MVLSLSAQSWVPRRSRARWHPAGLAPPTACVHPRVGPQPSQPQRNSQEPRCACAVRPVGGAGDAEAAKWSRPGRLGAVATPRGRGVAAGPSRRVQLLFLSSRKKTLLHLPRRSTVLVSAPGRAAVVKEPCCVKASLPPPVRGLGAMDSSALERDAVQFARLAVQRDHEGRYCEAVFYYKVNPEPRLAFPRPRGEVHVP